MTITKQNPPGLTGDFTKADGAGNESLFDFNFSMYPPRLSKVLTKYRLAKRRGSFRHARKYQRLYLRLFPLAFADAMLIEKLPAIDAKTLAWLKQSDPPNPHYQRMSDLNNDDITTICKMKAEGAYLRHITHKVDCSLQVVYDVLNQYHWSQTKLNEIPGQSNGHSKPATVQNDDLEYIQNELDLQEMSL